MIDNLRPLLLERIKAMCEGSIGDCVDAEARARSINDKSHADYWWGRADGFRAVVALIKALEEK